MNITWAEVLARHRISPFQGFVHTTRIGSVRAGPIITLYFQRGKVIILPLWTACRDVNPYDTFDLIPSPPLKVKGRSVVPQIKLGVVSFDVPDDGKIELLTNFNELPDIREIGGLSATDKARTRAWQASRGRVSAPLPTTDILLIFS